MDANHTTPTSTRKLRSASSMGSHDAPTPTLSKDKDKDTDGGKDGGSEPFQMTTPTLAGMVTQHEHAFYDRDDSLQLDEHMLMALSALKVIDHSSSERHCFDGDEEYYEEEDALRQSSYKRLADQMTIEGTPHIAGRPKPKRLGLQPTPISFRAPPSPTNVLAVSSVESTSPRPFSPRPQQASTKVLVIPCNSDMHNTGSGHQENAKRTELLCGEQGCLRRGELQSHIDWYSAERAIEPAPLADLLRVHEFTYIQHLEHKVLLAAANNAAGLEGATSKPPTTTSSIVNHTVKEIPSFYAPAGQLDTDTPLGADSLDAAKQFCGAAILAVDSVMGLFDSPSGPNANEDGSPPNYRRVFVLGRPPGHHAGPQGCVLSDYYWKRPDMTSSGFCLLNTVAVAAAYARYQLGALSKRRPSSNLQSAPKIAIVDIDVHHGNGTEEIVKNLRPRLVHLPLPSSWAPMTVTTFKPWFNESDADNVLFSSINLVAEERFYPCTGSDTPDPLTSNIINVGLTPVGPGPWNAPLRNKLSAAAKTDYCHAASLEFRTKVSDMLLPRLEAFQPDIIFISAGFDAHYDDFYHFLSEEDYHWVTDQLCQIADKRPSGPGAVISVLEGGYSLTASALSKPEKKKGPAAVKAATTAAQNAPPLLRSEDPNTKYAQYPGDGGLVKGVLAHAAGLAGVNYWTE